MCVLLFQFCGFYSFSNFIFHVCILVTSGRGRCPQVWGPDLAVVVDKNSCDFPCDWSRLSSWCPSLRVVRCICAIPCVFPTRSHPLGAGAGYTPRRSGGSGDSPCGCPHACWLACCYTVASARVTSTPVPQLGVSGEWLHGYCSVLVAS